MIANIAISTGFQLVEALQIPAYENIFISTKENFQLRGEIYRC
jgi:hypothetical protein